MVRRQKIIRLSDILAVQVHFEKNNAGLRKLPGTEHKNSRTGEVVYTPPQHAKVIAKLMDNLIQYINDDDLCEADPLVKMAIIHHQFESIHPFYDGNGCPASTTLYAGQDNCRRTFHRDRLVPMASELCERLKLYSEAIGHQSSDSIFFPAHNGRQYGGQGVYDIFRGLLDAAGIVHGGRGAGPRLHEVRHTFAVHRLEQWYHAGEDLNAKLPLLASYLGHRSMVGTQAYLQLTETLFTDITMDLDDAYGHVIPRGDC